jgi:hypothetical protein
MRRKNMETNEKNKATETLESELPYCTKAPSPEIKKSEEEDEPCRVF